MRAIVYVNGDVIVKRRAPRKYVLEYCKNNEVPDKLAYWKYTCLPEFRKKIEEPLQYKFINKKTGQILWSRHPDVLGVPNRNDYEACD